MSELLSKNAVIFLGGMLCGTVFTIVCIRLFRYSKTNFKGLAEYDNVPKAYYGVIKLVLVVRNDLKMGKGKVAAQCSHAAVLANELCKKKCPGLLSDWNRNGQPKIVVKVDSEEEMMKLADEARRYQLLTSIVQDAGRTQVPSGSKTVLAIGPGPECLIDVITGHLKLY